LRLELGDEVRLEQQLWKGDQKEHSKAKDYKEVNCQLRVAMPILMNKIKKTILWNGLNVWEVVDM